MTPVPRGLVLRPAAAAALPPRDRLHIGVGRALEGRVGLFRATEGKAIEMVRLTHACLYVGGDDGAACSAAPRSRTRRPQGGAACGGAGALRTPPLKRGRADWRDGRL